ncbi:flavin reductase [Faecalimonas sp.]
MNKNVFRNFSYGVYLVSSLDGERPTGCIANSVMQITSSPATIAISINHDNFTNFCISQSGQFAVSILSQNTSPDLIGQFGFQSGKDINKFENIPFQTQAGLPIPNNCCGYIICKVINTMETSTHTVFLGEVIDGDVINTEIPMTYSYYHQVIKGKSPKTAPTYIDEDSTSSNKHWICNVCGYIYDGDTPFEELPDTYQCPICKVTKENFIYK